MKPYPRYKTTGIEWLGEIPEHWQWYPIKRLSRVRRGASPRPIDNPEYFDENGEFAWVRIADVSASERYLEQTTQRLSEKGSLLSVKRNPGDFFLSIAGTVGKPIITKIKCCIHDGFVWFPDLKINAEFLYYLFTTGQPYLGLGKWGTQLNLNTDTVGYITIPIPPKKELESIISFLDEKTKQIDTLIEKKQKMIELLKEERQAVINEAVTKGIDPKTKMKDSGIEWLGEIPKHWEVKKLKHLIRIGNGEGVPTEFIKEEGAFPIYGGNGIMGYYSNNNSTGTELIIGRVGAKCGNVHLVEGDKWISDNALRATSSENYKYLFYLLSNLNLNTMANQSAQPLITGTQIKERMVSLPQIDEQKTIVSFLDKKIKEFDSVEEKAEKAIELLQEYRTALITEVVTGKVDVRGENV